MDAQKMLGLLKQLCNENIVNCKTCPIRKLNVQINNCWIAVLDNPQELEAVLLAYEKRKRGKTYLDLLRETFPHAKIGAEFCAKRAQGFIYYTCPHDCLSCWDVPVKPLLFWDD